MLGALIDHRRPPTLLPPDSRGVRWWAFHRTPREVLADFWELARDLVSRHPS